MSLAGLASRLATACGAIVVSGCALLPGHEPAAKPNAETERAGPPALRVTIDAPAPLNTLLQKYLDLTRLGALTRGDAVADDEWARLADASPAQVRELLQTEGYFSPTVTISREASAPDAPRQVRLTVQPGTRAQVSRVNFEVEGELQAQADAGDARARGLLDDLRRGFALKPTGIFRNADWSSAKASALAKLRAAGYATASWSGTAAEVDGPAGRVRLFLVADSGPLFKSGAIEIEGLVAHDAATVQHLAAFEPGTPLTDSLLLDFQERLQKSGLFESVTVTHDTDPARAAAAPVRVQLREQTLQVYTFGLGFSANTGPRATVEHVHRRLFGQPWRSRSFVELGRLRRALTLELSTHPEEGLYRRVAGVTIERLQTNSDVVLSERLRLGRARDTQAFEQLLFVEAERAERTTNTSRTSTFALSGNAHVVLRELDSVVLPTKGYTLSLQGGVGRSHGDNATTGIFSRAYGRLTAYTPLGSDWFAQGRVELGQVFRKNGVSAPDSQLFRAGGDDSVRGYAYRSLGPVVDGSVTSSAALFTTSVELARPISVSTPSLLGAVFIDAGRAATSFRDLTPAIGVGIGLRWRSPVGPLRLDWAWADELRRTRVHFSIGIAL
jgi:translocation and assembly module TamA